MINVTKTFLPPQGEYNDLVKRAWDNFWITNRGELTLELESKLKDYLNIDNIIKGRTQFFKQFFRESQNYSYFKSKRKLFIKDKGVSANF